MSICLLASAGYPPVLYDLREIGFRRFYFLEMATLIKHECARLLCHPLHLDAVRHLVVQVNAVFTSEQFALHFERVAGCGDVIQLCALDRLKQLLHPHRMLNFRFDLNDAVLTELEKLFGDLVALMSMRQLLLVYFL